MNEFDSKFLKTLSGSTMYAFFCFWNPIFASIIINQDWILYIVELHLIFKPWRLFMIVCGVPSVICGIVMLFMPESPKFTFSNGDEQKTLRILETMYKCNTGKSIQSFEVISLMKDDEFEENNKKRSSNFIQFVWSQTVPLFQRPHIQSLLKLCFIQFCVMNSSNGFWTFFPEIVHKISIWKQDATHVSSTICQILDSEKSMSTTNTTICITKLETSAYENIYILNSLYVIGWLVIALIINRLGKLSIIATLLFTCGTCAFAIIFVDKPLIANYLYVMLLCVGLSMTVVNASTVELFPTKFR